MDLYKIDKKLERIKEKSFRLEKDIQDLTEKNLNTIFGLELVKSEFAIKNFIIDTLAFDNEANAFVIIEYKRQKNFSVIDQGFSYLSSMLNNKADFILEFNENLKKTLKRSDCDWSQSRVLFVSPSFTNHQIEAINFKDLPIELWEVKKYENSIVSYDKIQKTGAKESIKTISKTNTTIDSVAKEIKVYSEQEHLENISVETNELYEKLKTAIQNLDNIEIKPRKKYIAFVAGRNIIDIFPLKNGGLKMWINMGKGELDDAKGIARDVSSIGHLGNGDYEIRINDDENLEYILSLVKQSIKKNKQ